MGFLFEKLEVYQRGLEFSGTIETLCDDIAKGNYHLVNQLRRAALSISLNIAEGNGRWHPRDRRNFFLIARGSAFECVPLLELCRRRKWIDEETHKTLKSELEVMCKMLSALVNKKA